MDDWISQQSYLAQSESPQDYLASLQSFLDGKQDISVNTLFPQNARLNEPSSPEVTSSGGSDSASPASSSGLAPAPPAQPTRGRRSDVSDQLAAAGAAGAGATQHDKRKSAATALGAVKDSRRGAAAAQQGHHSHPSGVDGELERSESPEDDSRGDGKGAKGKTSERRRAQNRQAQRNFRERKEKHLKDLEERVVSLEQLSKDQDAENAALKQLLENLQNENERLKVYETAFTFDYSKDATGMPQADQFNPAAAASQRLPTPPQSTHANSLDPNASFDGASSVGNDSFKFDTSLLGASTSSSSPLGGAYSTAPVSTAPVLDDSLFLGSAFAASPLSSVGGAGSNASLPTPPSATSSGMSPGASDLFTAYRDPLALLGMEPPALTTLGDFDALFAATPSSAAAASLPSPGAFLAATAASSLPSLTSSAATSSAPSPEDPLAQFLNVSPSPLSSGASPASTSSFVPPAFATSFAGAVGGAVPHDPATLEKYKPCQYTLKGEKYEFDVDGLCSEMKLKATCQEAARQALKSAMAEDAAASRRTYPAAQL
ncbi:uncharacterized protein JCM10292_000006 [Rhodotorula paludigena]|uniref:uncharacterized protein n=1 Tax=Rhodotorula paludigena TaxID=86838 RepID=UPI00317B7BE5